MRAQVDRVTTLCPGCFDIREQYLLGARPPSNGTYEAMHAFASTCDPATNARCRVLDGFEEYDCAELALQGGRLDDAQAAIDCAAALGDCARFLTLRARLDSARKNPESALADAQKALALDHAVEELTVEVEALNALHRPEPAGEALLEAARLDPTGPRIKELAGDTVRSLAYDGWKDAQAGRRDDGLRKFDLAAEIAPSTEELIAMRAQALMGDNPDLPALEAAVEKSPDDLRLHRELSYALTAKSDWGRIERLWTEYIGRHPDEGRAYVERSGTYRRQKRGDEARADAKKACDLGFSEGCLFAN